MFVTTVTAKASFVPNTARRFHETALALHDEHWAITRRAFAFGSTVLDEALSAQESVCIYCGGRRVWVYSRIWWEFSGADSTAIGCKGFFGLKD